MSETYTRWEPVSEVAAPCADIVLNSDPEDITVRLRFSRMRGAPRRDVLVRFGQAVVACMSHDEFVHPWTVADAIGEVPRFGEAQAGYAFPLLEVHASHWLASFTDSQILDDQRAGLRHFRFVSLDNTVDVLTAGVPLAEWVSPAP